MFMFVEDKDRGRSNKLREIAEENPEIQDVLLQKASLLDRNYANIIDKKKFLEVLAQVDDVLNKVEDQLSNHTGGNLIYKPLNAHVKINKIIENFFATPCIYGRPNGFWLVLITLYILLYNWVSVKIGKFCVL